MRNFYEVLGVDPGADDERIKDAFHSLAKIFHPDLNSGDEMAARRFREISQAYDTLRDHRTRAAYELGLVHQRKNSRRRVSSAAMTGFLTSMLSTIIISLAMIWLLTNGGQGLPSEQDPDATRPKRPVRAPQEKSLHALTNDLVRRLPPGRGGLQ